MNYVLTSSEVLHPETLMPVQEARLVVAQVGDLDPTSIDSIRTLAEKLQRLAGAITTLAEEHGEVELFPLGRAQRLASPQRTAALMRRFHNRNNPYARQVRMFLAHQVDGQSAAMSMHMIEGSSQWPLYNVVVPTTEQLDELLSGEDPSTWRDTRTVAQDFRGDGPEHAYPFHHELGSKDAPRRYLGILRQLSTDLLAATEQ